MDIEERLKWDFENAAAHFEKVFRQLANPKTIVKAGLDVYDRYYGGLLNSGVLGYPETIRKTGDYLARKMIGVYKVNDDPYPKVRIALGTGKIQLSFLIYTPRKKRWDYELLSFSEQLKFSLGRGMRYKIDAEMEYSYDPLQKEYTFKKYFRDFGGGGEPEQCLADLKSLEQLIGGEQK